MLFRIGKKNSCVFFFFISKNPYGSIFAEHSPLKIHHLRDYLRKKLNHRGLFTNKKKYRNFFANSK